MNKKKFKKEYLQAFLFVIILIFVLISLTQDFSVTWDIVVAIATSIGVIISLVALIFNYKKFSRELIIKKKLEIYEKIVEELKKSVYKDYFKLSSIWGSVKLNAEIDKECFFKKVALLSNEATPIIERLESKTSEMCDLPYYWKPIFSENFSEKIECQWKHFYDFSWLFLKENRTLIGEIEEVLRFKEKIDHEKFDTLKRVLLVKIEHLDVLSGIFSNSLEKIILDIPRELFGNSGWANEIEIENVDKIHGSNLPIITENGLELKNFKQTEFQKKFGFGKEREETMKKKIDEILKNL